MCLRCVKICLLALSVFSRHIQAQRYKTIYQKIQQEPEYSGFNALIRTNGVARLNLHYEPLTVFVPDNKAFINYDKELNSTLAFYHMSFEVKTLEALQTTRSISSVDMDNPPLWITKIDDDVYVNNAKILRDKSNHQSRSRDGHMGQEQVLHMIDEVLDPVIRTSKFSPNAFHFLSSAQKWDLTKTVTKYFHKVRENNLLDLYKQTGGHTFFIPVDSGVDSHKFSLIDKHVISGHIIPHNVLFTRPTGRNFAYESMANDEFVYTVLLFEEKDDTLWVKGLSKRHEDNRSREFQAEVVLPNIPVKNGVVHLISQPLDVFKRKLKPFPYLPILEKITNDPDLDEFYKMGEDTGFNKIFHRANVSFTYFVPKNTAWLKTRKHDLEPTDDDLTILRRHLVVAKTPFSMEELMALCRANNYTDIELVTQAGPLKVNVLKIDDAYYLKWNKMYIKVVRPDYECTNGVVHILAGPIVNFKRAEGVEIVEGRAEEKPPEVTESSLKTYWLTIRTILNV